MSISDTTRPFQRVARALCWMQFTLMEPRSRRSNLLEIHKIDFVLFSQAKISNFTVVIVCDAYCRLTKKAEPPPTCDVNRDSGTDSANGGWLRRLVRPRGLACHTHSINLPTTNRKKPPSNSSPPKPGQIKQKIIPTHIEIAAITFTVRALSRPLVSWLIYF